MDELLANARAGPSKSQPSPWVIADPFTDPEDSDVFAAVYAVQMLLDVDPWLVRGVLRRGGAGMPVLRRVAIEHLTDQSREVTGAVIRDVNFGAIRDNALAFLRERHGHATILRDAGLAVAPEWIEALRVASVEAAKAPGRRGHSINHYRRIALKYLDLVAEGRRDVLKALAEAEGVKRETVRGWLRKATTLELLAPGKQGRAGREPGPNLYRKEQNDA